MGTVARGEVVDHGGLAEEALSAGIGGLGSDLAAAALEALQHRGLLAADIRPGPDPQVQVEPMPGPSASGPRTPSACDLDRLLERRSGVRVLGRR